MMEREVGDRNFPIWLIGDSNPNQWESKLLTPFDPRHPARHSIWTPILDEIQDRVFRAARIRMDTSRIYIRNAVDDANKKPYRSEIEWKIDSEISAFSRLIKSHRPVILLSFGAFSFEFVRRSIENEEKHNYSFWGSERLGEAFRGRTKSFNKAQVNIFPLLHVSIARGKFIKSHQNFCGNNNEDANYFLYTSEIISEILLTQCRQLPIWIE